MEIARKSLLAGTVALAVIIASGAANAADLAARPYQAPPPAPPPVYNWTGLYVGVNAGVGIATTHLTTDPSTIIGSGNGDAADISDAGFTGGGQVGYNWQFAPNWVVGLEGDIGVLDTNKTNCDINDCVPNGDFLNLTSKSDFFATARGRFGYAWDRSLLYVTGGGAWVGVKDSWTDFVPSQLNSTSTTLGGWTVGGGLETALWQNLSLKAEYLFVDVGTNRVLDGDGDGSFIDFKHQYHVFRLGLNYRFGGPNGWGW